MHVRNSTPAARRLLVVVCLLAMALGSGATSALGALAAPSPKGTSGPRVASSLAPPANDDFADARVIAGLGDRIVDSNLGATAQTGEGEPAHAGKAAETSVWYRWTAPRNGQVVFRTRNSDFDTELAVYTGTTIDGLTEVASDDDTRFGEDLRQSQVEFIATQGTVYHVAVDGFSGATGSIVLGWTANDAFANAQTVLGKSGTALGSNLGATREAGEPAHDDNPTSASVWYRWTAPASGSATFDASPAGRGGEPGSDFDTVLAVYTGSSVANLTEVPTGEGLVDRGRLTFPAVAGTVYRIAVDGFEGAQGHINLRYNLAKPKAAVLNAGIVEGDAGTKTLSVPVRLLAQSGAPASVQFTTANRTATAPGDFTAKSGKVTFAPGETSKTIAVTVRGDTLKEPKETFEVQLFKPVGATIHDGSATVTITNDD